MSQASFQVQQFSGHVAAIQFRGLIDDILVHRAIEECLSRDCVWLMVEFLIGSVCTRTAMRQLLVLDEVVQSKGGRIALVQPASNIAQVCNSLNVSATLSIYVDRDTALRRLLKQSEQARKGSASNSLTVNQWDQVLRSLVRICPAEHFARFVTQATPVVLDDRTIAKPGGRVRIAVESRYLNSFRLLLTNHVTEAIRLGAGIEVRVEFVERCDKRRPRRTTHPMVEHEEQPIAHGRAHAATMPITCDEIVDVVANHYGVSISALQSPERRKAVALPRQVCMYLIKKLTRQTFVQIGRLFGNRDHTTVIHSIAKVARMADEVAEFRSLLFDFERKLDPMLPNGKRRKPRHVIPIAEWLPIDPRNTFDNFIIGPSNRIAQAAARAVTEYPGAAYNPLFLHGPSGVGKSHLLQAIALRMQQTWPKCRLLYISCETFVSHFVHSIRAHEIDRFQRQFREIDCLIIDDIHFLAGDKSRSQDVFYHTFNALHGDRKQIVLSSDSPPGDIPQLQDRLISRFKSGLQAMLEPPQFETRLEIVRNKARQLQTELSNETMHSLAESVVDNVWQIEGAIKTYTLQAKYKRQELRDELPMPNQVDADARSSNNKVGAPQEQPAIITQRAPALGHEGAPPDEPESSAMKAPGAEQQRINSLMVLWLSLLLLVFVLLAAAGAAALAWQNISESLCEHSTPNEFEHVEAHHLPSVAVRIPREHGRTINNASTKPGRSLHAPARMGLHP